MSEDAYMRIALRLRDLSDADREWLLAHLDADDCRRVSAALRQYRAQSAAGGSRTHGAGSESSTSRAAGPGASAPEAAAATDPVSRLTSVTAADAKKLLWDEPDWAIALVLGASPWPWSETYLDELGPDRIRALRALARELSTGVKPKVRDSVLRAIALKLQPEEPSSAVTEAFDAALKRAEQDLTALQGWRAERI